MNFVYLSWLCVIHFICLRYCKWAIMVNVKEFCFYILESDMSAAELLLGVELLCAIY